MTSGQGADDWERVLSRDHPLSGPAPAHLSFGYDMPGDLGGGFGSSELLPRGDDVLLRRHSKHVHTEDEDLAQATDRGKKSFGEPPESNPERAASVLNYHGYDLHALRDDD